MYSVRRTVAKLKQRVIVRPLLIRGCEKTKKTSVVSLPCLRCDFWSQTLIICG